MVIEAMKRGFDSIGFSERVYLPYSLYPQYQMGINAVGTAKAEICLLKEKYKGNNQKYYVADGASNCLRH